MRLDRRSFLLSLVFITASHGSHSPFTHGAKRTNRLRRQSGPTLPGSWSSIGCYLDNVQGRALTAAAYTSTTAMTVESCINFCDSRSYNYAGLEWYQECYCGNFIVNGGAQTTASDCSFPCTGNSAEVCGAGNRLSMYYSGRPSPPAPEIVPSVGQWQSLGCYSDNVGGRTLPNAVAVSSNTIQSCTSACQNAGYTLAGAEYSAECWCGNSVQAGGAPATASDCNMLCSGNNTQYCGGPNRLNLYSFTNAPATPSWKSLGCYSDNVNGRALPNPVAVSSNTVESCTAACHGAGYGLAGMEYSAECWCGNTIGAGGAPASASDCNMMCSGNNLETCGGPNRLSVYNNTNAPPTRAPSSPSTVGLWQSLGCYSDNVGGRTLPNAVGVTSNTIESCTLACKNAGYTLAGMEYSAECWCGTSIQAGGAPASASGCNMLCSGNSTEYCGGPNRLTLYNYTGTPSTTPPPRTDGLSPVTGLPGNWTYNGCWTDNVNGRVFPKILDDNAALTTAGCTAACSALNYTIAGIEWSVQCMCGNYLIAGAVKNPDSSTCNMGCGGNPSEECGGPNRLSVYSSTGNVTALPVAVPLTTGLPGQWQYVGCLAEPGAVRVFPNKIVNTVNNTVQACLKRCSDYGFAVGGLEYSEECYCGDFEEIAANGGVMRPDSECNMLCNGDPYHLCGGQQRLQLYQWNGNLNVWHEPQNTGDYQFLISSPIVPLIATQGVNNKVTFVEKWGTSVYPNSTGAYELDLTLVNDYTKTWRAMHVASDVFCAASVVLPDKGGRQLMIGGWSVDSLYGVRLYTPDGSAGVNGTNDWEEDLNIVSLQRGRWYPSALVMANGSVLVVGGEHGSNGVAEPTLEILPKPAGGDTVMYLDWLQRTDPNNLYPFLHVLPNSGNVFVAYWNEARILDKVTLNTAQVLPNLPGSVISSVAGRNYPLSGASALFPQHYPYTDPLEILFCGGSDVLEFQRALDNCISIQPEVPQPTWTIERMPSQRVMACMATLPDGTFIIMNGAHTGVAGFGLASDPNLDALLYDPSLPVGQRISKLGSTIVARMYHSEAILLNDGRVLVSGSDPQTYRADGSEVYPEEFRVEVYYPPYLTDGTTQPTYTIANTDWQYGQPYQINVHLFQGSTANMRVSLVASISSTHGNSMGSRILFPKVSCAGNVCTIEAPPNANVCPPGWFMLFVLDGPTPSHSQWVRIGGDPAKLGLWPEGGVFTPPGI